MKSSEGDDQRQGVTEAGHRMLDCLDAGRPGWGQLTDEALAREITIEIAGYVGWALPGQPTAARLAALLIYQMERAEG